MKYMKRTNDNPVIKKNNIQCLNYCLVIREATLSCYLMTVYEHMSDCSNLYTARRNTIKTVSELFVVCLNHSVASCIPL